MIAELAAFNAAFGVVKEFVANGRDLSDCFGFIGQMTTAKEDLKLKADKRGFTSDAEEFAALEHIKQAEQELRELMQYMVVLVCGRTLLSFKQRLVRLGC
jgi:hypothetical protein